MLPDAPDLVPADFARQLERELAAMGAAYVEMHKRILELKAARPSLATPTRDWPEGITHENVVYAERAEKAESASAPPSPLAPLIEAVEALYFSAHWHADRPVDEAALWTAVRNAAGIKPGQTGARLGPDRSALPDAAQRAIETGNDGGSLLGGVEVTPAVHIFAEHVARLSARSHTEQQDEMRDLAIESFIETIAGPGFTREEVRVEAKDIIAGKAPYARSTPAPTDYEKECAAIASRTAASSTVTPNSLVDRLRQEAAEWDVCNIEREKHIGPLLKEAADALAVSATGTKVE